MKQTIKRIPKPGDVNEDVSKMQAALFCRGFYTGVITGKFDSLTTKAVSAFQKSIGLPGSGAPGPKTIEVLDLVLETTPDKNGKYPAWYLKAKEYEGKKETDSKFQAYMNPFWAKVGLPNFKGLVGSARAWCALAVFMALSAAGYQTGKLNASAISGDNAGVKIDWKANGIPRGAIVRINHGSNCKTSSNNHIGFADGDCTPADLLKPNAKFNMYGGNQGDSFKVSSFPVNDICSVTWPKGDAEGNPIPLPGKVEKSDHCTGAATPAESTR